MIGLITRSTGSWYDVKAESGEAYQCRLRGKIKLKGAKVTNPVAVGDRVKFFQAEGEPGMGLIEEVMPRENYVTRKSTHKTGHAHLIASNLDQVVLIVTLKMPKTSTGFIDRFLVTAESFRIPAALVFNKQDLLNEDDKRLQEELFEVYASLKYHCIAVSAKENINLDQFAALLDHKVSLLSGHSGSGKSTLINKLKPELNLKTGSVSEFANKGKHTTTYAEMFSLGDSTSIIDTPGIKEFGLIDIEDEELSHFFPEMRERFGACKYYNCMHLQEPKCAVRAAVEEGEIALSRYYNYLSMLENEDNRR